MYAILFINDIRIFSCVVNYTVFTLVMSKRENSAFDRYVCVYVCKLFYLCDIRVFSYVMNYNVFKLVTSKEENSAFDGYV